MECSCEIDCDVESVPVRFYNKQNVIAIITHKCTECERDIQEGEEYELVHGEWDEVVDTLSICSDCVHTRDIFFPCGYYYSMMWEEIDIFISECDYELSESCISSLTPRAREKVCKRIEDSWDD